MTVQLSVYGPGESPFDQIMRKYPDGTEHWSARELAPYMGYASWDRFPVAIERGRQACQNSGYDHIEHFRGASKVVDIGSGARRSIPDVHLSRLGCYLTALN